MFNDFDVRRCGAERAADSIRAKMLTLRADFKEFYVPTKEIA